MIKLKGKTPEEKFRHIEIILNRMSRKLHKTVVGVIPPIPVMLAVDKPAPDGLMFSYLAPAIGRISDICMIVKNYAGKDPVEFEASVSGPTSGAMTKFVTRKPVTITNVNLPVNPGDLLILKTTSPDAISEIWLSFLYHIRLNKSEKMSFIAEELLQLVEEESDAIAE